MPPICLPCSQKTVDEQKCFTLRVKIYQTPCSLDNQKKLLQGKFYIPETVGQTEFPLFASQTNFWQPNPPGLASSSTKDESGRLGSTVLQFINANSPQLVPVPTGQGNNISAR